MHLSPFVGHGAGCYGRQAQPEICVYRQSIFSDTASIVKFLYIDS